MGGALLNAKTTVRQSASRKETMVPVESTASRVFGSRRNT